MDLAASQQPSFNTSFFKTTLLFPLAPGTGAKEKWNEHAQTRSFITSFSAKNFGICDACIAPISSRRVLENVRPYLISLIIYRLCVGKTWFGGSSLPVGYSYPSPSFYCNICLQKIRARTPASSMSGHISYGSGAMPRSLGMPRHSR